MRHANHRLTRRGLGAALLLLWAMLSGCAQPSLSQMMTAEPEPIPAKRDATTETDDIPTLIGRLGEGRLGEGRLGEGRLGGQDPLVKEKAAQQLAKIGEPAIPALIDALGNSDEAVIEQAYWVLQEIGHPAVYPLIEAMQDETRRPFAVMAVGMIGAEALDAIPALLNALNDSNPEVANSAAWALGNMGESARGAVPVMTHAMEATKDATLRRNLERSLDQIQRESPTDK